MSTKRAVPMLAGVLSASGMILYAIENGCADRMRRTRERHLQERRSPIESNCA